MPQTCSLHRLAQAHHLWAACVAALLVQAAGAHVVLLMVHAAVVDSVAVLRMSAVVWALCVRLAPVAGLLPVLRVVVRLAHGTDLHGNTICWSNPMTMSQVLKHTC